MRKTLTVMTLVMALLVSTMSMALANADKAMGSIEDEIRTFEYVAHGTWTNKGGKELLTVTSFKARGSASWWKTARSTRSTRPEARGQPSNGSTPIVSP
jgi:hypothetical protein